MNCYNKNLPEYKNLVDEFISPLKVDGIINAWQKAQKVDTYPTVAEAQQLLQDIELAYKIQVRDFKDNLLANIINNNLAYKNYGRVFVNNSKTDAADYSPEKLGKNIKVIYNYLSINNIPKEAVAIITKKTANGTISEIVVNEKALTKTDIIKKSRSWDTPRTRHVVGHLKRLIPGITISYLSVEEAQKYYNKLPAEQKANVNFSQVKSFFNPLTGEAILIKGRVTDETAIEEILHPFVDGLYADNRKLFDNLLVEAKKMFPILNQEIEKTYTDIRGFDAQYRELELVTQALSRHFKKEYEENPTKTFKERIKEFLEWFANIIENIRQYITGKTIKETTTQTKEIKPGVAELFESNPELANAVYEALGFSSINEAEITYTNEEGDICAKNGVRGAQFTKGSQWEIVKDLKGYPSHANGGVNIQLGKDGVNFTQHNAVIKAAYGLVLPKIK